jgi:hypothetical protein
VHVQAHRCTGFRSALSQLVVALSNTHPPAGTTPGVQLKALQAVVRKRQGGKGRGTGRGRESDRDKAGARHGGRGVGKDVHTNQGQGHGERGSQQLPNRPPQRSWRAAGAEEAEANGKEYAEERRER